MKKVKAAKSASDIGLRGAATGAASNKSAFPTLRKKNTFSPGKKKGKGSKPSPTGTKKVRSTREKQEVGSNVEDAVVVKDSPINVKSERTTSPSSSPKAVGGSSKPKAIGAPPKAPSKPKKSGTPRAPKEKTRTVFVAEPKVTIEDGPDFGKVTHDITKTKQPVNPRQFR